MKILRCHVCKQETDDLRFNVCFDCACKGEERAAMRTVAQHLAVAIQNAKKGRWWECKCDLRWAFQRATQTGDYAKDGYFDSEGIDWRANNTKLKA